MPDFREVGRIKVSPSVSVILSKTFRGEELTGYSLNKYINADDYKGYAKGIFIPIGQYPEFLKLVKDAESIQA